MDLTRKKDLKKILQAYDIRLTSDLGQHYLVSKEILAEILFTADIQPTEQVIETGAGIGTLTVELDAMTENLTTIEIDEKIFGVLHVMLGGETTVNMILGDALDAEIPAGDFKWVANVPYQITSPLIKKFLDSDNVPVRSVLMIQKEVAQKICTKKNKGENRISLLVKNFTEPRLICGVHREQFFPPPRVESAVVCFDRLDKPVIPRELWGEAERLQKIGFASKRKKLKNNFGNVEGGLELLEKAGIDPDMRAENLTLEQWRDLAEASSKD